MKVLQVLVVLLATTACNSIPELSGPKPGQKLSFIHLNDTYRIGPVEDGKAGGFGRVATIIRETQASGRDVRILHGGDFLYPSLESQLWNGQQMVDAFNFLDDIAPMLVVAGNHELDRGTPEHLVSAMRASRFQWLGDNYRLDTGDAEVDKALHQAYIYEHDGKRVGVFALTLHADDGGNERAYAPVDKDYRTVAERTIKALESGGADVIIGLTHLHLWQDADIAKLKRKYPTFLFIVGGHEHEPEYMPSTESSAAIMKGASNARVIWRIDVEFFNGRPRIADSERISVGEQFESAPDYDALHDKWRTQLLAKFPFLTATIGYAAEPLDGREFAIRDRETNFGNLVTDQMRRAFGEPLADLAFINSGTLRIDDFIANEIRFEDIGRTFGFSSYLRYLMLTGSEFRHVLEAGFRGNTSGLGHFPQVSGFRVCVDRSRSVGQRIVGLQVPTENGWQGIDAEREYVVVVPDYLYRGGDGYRFPPHRKASRPGSELKYLVLDAIMAAQAQGRKVGAQVDQESPRIVVKQQSSDPCWP